MALGERRSSAAELWPRTVEELHRLQSQLGAEDPESWTPSGDPVVAGCFFCHRPGRPEAWAAAVLYRSGHPWAASVVDGRTSAGYERGYLALREGPLLEQAVRGLDRAPEVLLVNATGRDHPRRAGLAIQLGAVLETPTVGVTERLLVASGDEPGDDKAASTPVYRDGEPVGFWVRTRAEIRAVAAHAGWRTTAEVARDLVLANALRARTPEPIRRARHLARRARAAYAGS